MYCQSCQTKLSPRDTRCPTCGRRTAAGSDLGSGAGPGPGDSQSYPLPPATTLDEDSDSMSQRVQKPKPSAASSQPSRPAPARKERRSGDDRRKAPSRSSRESQSQGSGSVSRGEVLNVLAEQPSLIEAGLKIYREDGEAVGLNYGTAVGDIDLLGKDDAGAWVVVLVADPDRTKDLVSDLLQRMGWVRRHLGSSGEEVRAIVLLESLPDDLGYAAAAVSDSIEFKLYQLQLTFEPVIL